MGSTYGYCPFWMLQCCFSISGYSQTAESSEIEHRTPGQQWKRVRHKDVANYLKPQTTKASSCGVSASGKKLPTLSNLLIPRRFFYKADIKVKPPRWRGSWHLHKAREPVSSGDSSRAATGSRSGRERWWAPPGAILAPAGSGGAGLDLRPG